MCSANGVEGPAKRRSLAYLAFFIICLICEAMLFIFDRTYAYTALGAFAYGVILWLIARACIRDDAAAEEAALKPRASASKTS